MSIDYEKSIAYLAVKVAELNVRLIELERLVENHMKSTEDIFKRLERALSREPENY